MQMVDRLFLLDYQMWFKFLPDDHIRVLSKPMVQLYVGGLMQMVDRLFHLDFLEWWILRPEMHIRVLSNQMIALYVGDQMVILKEILTIL
jgi:hypothetical protein